jgi:uncharacterized protein YfaQ (DUF2300 family)
MNIAPRRIRAVQFRASPRRVAVLLLNLAAVAGALAAGPPASVQPAQDCRRQPRLEAWLQAQADRWQRLLAAQPGYERPDRVIVCLIDRGNPYVDYDRGRLYLRSRDADEDRLSLAHEYLHLAFKYHPIARDERFIETTARKLVAPYSSESEPP